MVVNKKKVLRITSCNNLLSAIHRRKIVKFKLNGSLKYENVLNRKTPSDTLNTDWVTDISYIIMRDGTAYFSAIRDLCGQFIVAHRTARRQEYSLVKNTIADAMLSEKPKKPPLLHSDGGGQYRSYDHKKVVEEYGLTPSMSKPSTPGDNAMAENFFSIFKTECISKIEVLVVRLNYSPIKYSTSIGQEMLLFDLNAPKNLIRCFLRKKSYPF